MKQGNLNDRDAAKRFDNPAGYPGLKGIPKRDSLEAVLGDYSSRVLVDTSVKTHSPPKEKW